MLDIKFIRENKELVAANNRARRVTGVDLEQLLSLDKQRTEIRQQVEQLRAERNKRSKTRPSDEEIQLIRKVGDEINELERSLLIKEQEIQEILFKLPNLTHQDVPQGEDDAQNKVVREVGERTSLGFAPREHWQLGESLGVIDLESAAQVSGSRFAYLKGKLVLLEFALIQLVFNLLTDEKSVRSIIDQHSLAIPSTPFVPVLPPVFIKPDVMHRMGRLEPREERYNIPSDDLYLIGSAEHTLGPLHMNSVLSAKELPIRYIGFSTAFRREAGSYGKDTKGIFRVHQFDKLEMESFTLPEFSEAEQDFFVAIQEHLMQTLGIPYRVVLKCTGDMGLPDYREYDIEAWLPGQGKYRETHTADLMTDFQSRRLNIRVKREDGSIHMVHMNDATALAIGRTLIAIMENYQTEDGHITTPPGLRPFLAFASI